MLSIQEMVNKTESQRKAIEANLDASPACYDHDMANLFAGQGKADSKQIMETLRNVSLQQIVRRCTPNELGFKVREFLASSGTTGIAGAVYLIPTKIYQIMFDSAVQADICDQISIAMVPAEEIPGTTLQVDIAKDGSYVPKKYSSGGAMPAQTIETVKATLDFSESFGINFPITNDLIEDSQFDLIEMHLRNAGREMGEYASNLAVGILTTATDGDGTFNGSGVATTTAVTTKWQGDTTSDVEKAIDWNCQDGYLSNTILISHHAMMHSVIRTLGTATTDESQPWIYHRVAGPDGGWPTKMFDHNIVYSEVDNLTNSGTYDPMKTVVFQKEYALLTGRKRWLRIEKYSNPIKDLVGATVTARQDSVTVYNDSIAIITETT